jgi:hypothetical protein
VGSQGGRLVVRGQQDVDMQLTLTNPRATYHAGEQLELRARYTNDGAAPIALSFWWNREMRVLDSNGVVVVPLRGAVLPCGMAEDLEIVEPGASFERDEPFGCTQPAGRTETIGWSYQLAPGTYSIGLVFESPPAHGFVQHAPDPREFRGRVESNPVTVTITPAPARKKLFGIF